MASSTDPGYTKAFPIKSNPVEEKEKGKEGDRVKEECWDPFTSSDWDNQKPTSEAILRIKRDLQMTFTEPPPGIFVMPSGDDITRLHVLITGPFDTPYEGGFFQFMVRFPPNYPFKPPRVKFLTTGLGTVRFNPNLYCNGKVCLSLLGTWPGPQWTASQNLSSILVSIQSLLNEKPLQNEPGFEMRDGFVDGVEDYNNMVCHETLRVAVCDSLERKQCPSEVYEVMRCSFEEYYEYYITTAKKFIPKLDGQVIQDPFNSRRGTFNFSRIAQRLETLRTKLLASGSKSLES